MDSLQSCIVLKSSLSVQVAEQTANVIFEKDTATVLGSLAYKCFLALRALTALYPRGLGLHVRVALTLSNGFFFDNLPDVTVFWRKFDYITSF